MELKDMIYETENFAVFVARKPHIDRLDGGHLVISAKEKYFSSRVELSPKEAIEVMRLSMIVGEAMQRALNKRGLDVERINYQENGNWAFIKNERPFFHIHIYGRTVSSKNQKWGEALHLPHLTDDYYKDLEPLNEEDIAAILEEIDRISKAAKYSLDKWGLD